MRDERGQASIEWVGAVLLAALALAGLARLSSSVEAADLATAPLRTTICATAAVCAEKGRSGSPRARRPRAVIAPPLLPVHPAERRTARPSGLPGLGSPAAVRRARRAAGAFWRRSWLVCFGYERARYGLLHPETAPRQTVPIKGALQMVNDCASPIDFARDWELLRGR